VPITATINNPEVVLVFVSRVPCGPTTDALFICTGTAVFDFTSNNGPRTDVLEFPVPDGDGSPLTIPQRALIDSAAVVSLSDIDNLNTTCSPARISTINDQGGVG
jgi:hypothetical protein